jgi:hypothetical protein
MPPQAQIRAFVQFIYLVPVVLKFVFQPWFKAGLFPEHFNYLSSYFYSIIFMQIVFFGTGS